MQRVSSWPRMSKVWPYLFCAPFLVAYFLFIMFPTIYSFYLSFFSWNGVKERLFVGIQNYVTLFTKDPMFLKSLGNTAILMGLSTPITVALGLILANSLFHLGRGRMA